MLHNVCHAREYTNKNWFIPFMFTLVVKDVAKMKEAKNKKEKLISKQNPFRNRTQQTLRCLCRTQCLLWNRLHAATTKKKNPFVCLFFGIFSCLKPTLWAIVTDHFVREHTHTQPKRTCCAVQNVCRFWFGMAGLSLCFIPFPFPCHRKTPWWSIVYVPNLWINCCPSMFKFLII